MALLQALKHVLTNPISLLLSCLGCLLPLQCRSFLQRAKLFSPIAPPMEAQTDPNVDKVKEAENLEHAHLLWERLHTSEYDPQERMIHLWRILELANYARLSPVLVKAKSGVYDVISLGVSEDGQEMRGASSKLRGTMRINQFDRDPKSIPYKARKDVWPPHGEGAFQDKTSRLRKELQKEFAEKGLDLPEEPDKTRKYESCAEHVVYEKLSRLGRTPKFVYTVQKTVRDIKAKCDVFKYQVKVVHRCENCMIATNHLGHVVTDHELLVDLHVPVVTPPVLRFFRGVTHSEQVLPNPFLKRVTTVWLHLGLFGRGKVLLSKSGHGGAKFDEEMAAALAASKEQSARTSAG